MGGRKNQISISKSMGDPFSSKLRKGECQTNDWIFYVSRPPLKCSENQERGFSDLHCGERDHREIPSSTPILGNHRADVKPFTIGTLPCGDKDHPLYCTLSYPFDIRDEIDNKLGVVLHVSEGAGYKAEPLEIKTGDNYPSMFDEGFMDKLRQELEGLKNNNHGKINPPGWLKPTRCGSNSRQVKFYQQINS